MNEERSGGVAAIAPQHQTGNETERSEVESRAGSVERRGKN